MVTDGRPQFVIQRVAGRGYALSQVRSDTLRVGRGTNAELRSENPAVALEHAVIEMEGGGYKITDKGSITGTYVNRKPVETARLSKGDIIEIGDLRIDVQLVEPGKPLFLRVVPTAVRAVGAVEEEEDAAAPATPGARVVRAKKVDYVSSYRLSRPWLTKLTLTALGLIIALAVIGEVIRPEKQKAFMPGGLSSAHARARDSKGHVVAEQCSACHSPWRSVDSGKCLDCHPRPPHAKDEINPPECHVCHGEHRGQPKLAANADERCTGCHADLAKHVRPGVAIDKAVASISAFGPDHPQLVPPNDPDTVRFNHRLHLASGGVFNATGRREKLQCTNCHNLVTVKDKTDPAALDFESHCQRCHRLTFDAKLPDAEVPHGGDPKNVYGYIAYLYAGNRELVGKPPDVVRRILATRRSVELDARAQINAEQIIKTKCQKCHDLETRGGQLIVPPPVIRRDWFTGAKFSHGSHATVACEKCHDQAGNSALTADVLMPAREDCTDCHARDAKGTQAASTCKTCHEYHLNVRKRVVVASLVPAGASGLGRGGRMLQGILLAVIVILLLVVLVPVGIALFQRLRPAPPERGAAPRTPAPPPPARPMPPPPAPEVAQAPTTPIPRNTPAPAPPPPPDATVMQQLPDTPAAPGTQMVEWYGLLNCTGGALEGQRFVIEEEGFYIGRDPALSTVVVNDTRVSKRHVRIVPRNGKVWAIDQNSTNGTFLGKADGQRITEVQLKRGDVLILADNAATFVYQI